MQYPEYDEYKDSDVDFIGSVPSHWSTWKVAHGFSKVGSGTTPKSSNPKYYDGNIPWVTTSELREKLIEDTKQKITLEARQNFPTLALYKEGSLIIAMYGATIGRLGILGIDATVNQACCVFAAPEQFSIKFFYYWLWMRRPTLISLSVGGGQPNLSQEDLKQIRVPIPSIAEQKKIAAFLDYKTGQIDALIEKKKELIKKLEEQRISVITQAVTKGIDKSAKLKPSSVDWLGDIPEHWEVKKLKFIGKAIIGLTYSPSDITNKEGGVLVLRSSNIQDGVMVDNDNTYVSTKIPEKLRTQKGDILVCSRNGSRALIGKNAKITPEYTGMTFGAFTTIIRSEINDFLYHIFNSSLFTFQSGRYLTSTINQLTIGAINSFEIPIPPPREQKEITEFLNHYLKKNDRAKKANLNLILKLQEYRSALITAAVTGKIDVRDVKCGSGGK